MNAFSPAGAAALQDDTEPMVIHFASGKSR